MAVTRADYEFQTRSTSHLSQTVTYNTAIGVGDLLVAIMSSRPQGYSGAAPTHQVSSGGTDWTEAHSEASTNHRGSVWWRVAEAGEPTGVLFESAHPEGEVRGIYEIWRFTGATEWIVAAKSGADSGGSNVDTLDTGPTGALPAGTKLGIGNGSNRSAGNTVSIANPSVTEEAPLDVSQSHASVSGYEDLSAVTASQDWTFDATGNAQMYAMLVVFQEDAAGPPTREYTGAGTVGSFNGAATYTVTGQTREYTSSGTVGQVDGAATYTVQGQTREYTAVGVVGGFDGTATYTVSGQVRDYTSSGTVGSVDGFATYTVSGQLREYTASGVIGAFDGSATYTRTPQTREYTSSGTVGQVTGSGTYTVQGADEYTAAGTVGQVQGSATYTRQAQTREYTAAGVIGQVDGDATYTKTGAVREYTAAGTIGSVDGTATYTTYTPQVREYTASGQVGAVVGTAAYQRVGPILSGTARILRIDSPTANLTVSAATATLTINKDTTP